MKNKRRIKTVILAALVAVTTLIMSGCVKKDYQYTGKVKVFPAGTHFISIPIEEKYYRRYHQLECPEGYKINSISAPSKSIGIILYENTVAVECTETEDGYVLFGLPVEEVNTKKLN